MVPLAVKRLKQLSTVLGTQAVPRGHFPVRRRRPKKTMVLQGFLWPQGLGGIAVPAAMAGHCERRPRRPTAQGGLAVRRGASALLLTHYTAASGDCGRRGSGACAPPGRGQSWAWGLPGAGKPRRAALQHPGPAGTPRLCCRSTAAALKTLLAAQASQAEGS